MYYTCILQSQKTGRYYIGSTVNIDLRLARHNSGHNLSTKAYLPWILKYSETFETLTAARRREKLFKSWKNPDYMLANLGLSR